MRKDTARHTTKMTIEELALQGDGSGWDANVAITVEFIAPDPSCNYHGSAEIIDWTITGLNYYDEDGNAKSWDLSDLETVFIQQIKTEIQAILDETENDIIEQARDELDNAYWAC